MVHTIVDGTFRQTNLTNDSSEYLARREELRLAEIELMRQRERVAELRRHLPQGAPIEDYSFAEGPRDLRSPEETQDIVAVRTTHLSELFTKPNRSLIIYHLKYGKRQTKPCPMCTAWLDGVNGVAHRLAQNLDFALVAAADVPTLRAHAHARGWDKLSLLSAGHSTFKSTSAAKTAKGIRTRPFPFSPATPTAPCATSTPGILAWPSRLKSAASTCSLLCEHFLELTPQGRGNCYTSLDYGTKVQAAST